MIFMPSTVRALPLDNNKQQRTKINNIRCIRHVSVRNYASESQMFRCEPRSAFWRIEENNARILDALSVIFGPIGDTLAYSGRASTYRASRSNLPPRYDNTKLI